MRYQIAEVAKNNLFPESSNNYIGIGRPIRWGNDTNESDDEIEQPIYTKNYRDQLYRDLVAIKKIEAADISFVIPRVDWESNTVYDMYNDHTQIFSNETVTVLGNVDVTGTSVLSNTGSNIFEYVDVNDLIRIGDQTREVVVRTSSNNLTINLSFTSNYVNTECSKIDVTELPELSTKFYVRNSRDQIFKCLSNLGIDDGLSTIEPTIDVDGNLPENPYIEPGDGYKWKYMYTIPYGLKQRFFTKEWMPVITEDQVKDNTIDGRIDIIEILDGGTGYTNGSSVDILNVSGDGYDARITAQVVAGTITDVNILNGGYGYSNAIVTASDSNQSLTGNTASFDVIIGPPGGHGYDAAKELGCSTIMLSVTLNSPGYTSEDDKIPVSTLGNYGDFDFRQISIIRDPLDSDGYYANDSVYRATTKVSVSSPGITDYQNDETVTEPSISTRFDATVVYWDNSSNELYLNNIAGNLFSGATIRGSDSGATSIVIDIDNSEITPYSGDLTYIENRAKVIRDIDQSEQIRITFSF